jgi:hypothetical protein
MSIFKFRFFIKSTFLIKKLKGRKPMLLNHNLSVSFYLEMIIFFSLLQIMTCKANLSLLKYLIFIPYINLRC